MSLRLVNKLRSYPIIACDTTFQIISMSVGEKELLVSGIQTIGSDDGAFDRLLDVIAPVIMNIEGFDNPVRETLSKLEDVEQLRAIIKAIIAHCILSKEEAKNLSSSSEQPTPGPVGSVEKLAEVEDEAASTIPVKTD